SEADPEGSVSCVVLTWSLKLEVFLSRLFLRPQRLLVTFQGFIEPLHPVEQAAFVKIGNRHRIVRGNCPIVTINRVVGLSEWFQRRALLDQRLGVPTVEQERLIEGG